jgi:hypothetical protein
VEESGKSIPREGGREGGREDVPDRSTDLREGDGTIPSVEDEEGRSLSSSKEGREGGREGGRTYLIGPLT